MTQVDSTVAYDTFGRRIPLFHPLARALVKELGRGGREVPRLSEADKRRTPLGQGLEIAWPRASYYGRLASQHTDTLRITNLLPRGRTVRLVAPLLLSLPDTVAMPPRVGTSPVPFVLRFEELEQSLSLTIQLPNDTAFHHRLTLYGYDIGTKQLTDRSSSAQTVHLRSRNTLYLHLPDAEKLLLIYRGHRLIDRLPIGRQRDVVDLSQYRRGRYLLEFVDLAAQRSRYARLRLGR